MGSGDAADAVEAVVSDATSARAAEAFGALSDDTRLAILLALWEAYEPFADDNTVSFSELRKRVGMSDSGRFNYHLDKLVGTFIEATDEGYTLRTAGHNIIQAVVGGIGIDEPTFEASDLEWQCPNCETPTAVTYEDQTVTVICPDCESTTVGTAPEDGKVIMELQFDPAGVAERTAEETIIANSVQELHKNGMRLFGVCPECSGTVVSSFEVCETHDGGPDQFCPHCGHKRQVHVRFVCTICKDHLHGPVNMAAYPHPAVQTFVNEHGYNQWFEAGASTDVESQNEMRDAFDFHQEILSEDPLRVEMTATHDSGDMIQVVFNEAVEIVDIDRTG